MSNFITDSAGMFLARQLQQFLPKLYRQKYGALWAAEGLYLPAVADLKVGARTLVEQSLTDTGEAAIISDSASDSPLVDASINEFDFPAVTISAGVRFSVTELNADEMANRDIRGHKLYSLQRALMQRVHQLSCFGSPKIANYDGFINSSLVDTVDATASYAPYNPATTAQEHIAFFGAQYTRVQRNSFLTEGVKTVLVPIDLLNAWRNVLVPNTPITVLSQLLDAYGPNHGGTLERIATVNELNSEQLQEFIPGYAAGQERMLFLPYDSEAVERRYYETRFLPQQLSGMNYNIYAYCGTSAPIFHYPGGMLYVDFSTATS